MPKLTLALVASMSLLAQAPATVEAPKASRPGASYRAPSAESPAAKILAELKARQEAVANLEFLCDEIGPRLTGSERLLKAHDWIEGKMRAYGFEGVAREAYAFGPSWTRGTAKARLLGHNGLDLNVAQMAWSPATAGPVRGALLLMNGDIDELVAQIGHLKGRIVLLGEPPKPKGDPKEFGEKIQKVLKAMKEEGIAALILASDKKDGQMNMGGGPGRSMGLPPVPTAVLQYEHAQLLLRLAARKQPVELELDLGGKASAGEVQAHNSMGEIRGSEKPDEVVLLGAHMDSWDLGTGATDNGTGTVAVLEALRAIKASGQKPKRTIRVVLFSGEEQGLYGSKAYAAAHKDELGKLQAVLIHDLGSGRVNGWALQGREDLRPWMARAIAPLQEEGVKELPLEGSSDSDHAPFVKAGVPAFFAIQEQLDYFTSTHHSQTDTFDHVKPADLVQGAAALAITAWELATMDERLPHKEMKAPPKDVTEKGAPKKEASGH